MNEVADLIIEKFDGCLRGEHATVEIWRLLSKRMGSDGLRCDEGLKQ